MNKIWLGILLISFLYGIITKRFDTMATIILSLPQKGLELVCTLVFSAVFWNGIMYILADCGAIQFISKLLTPLLDLIMPQMKDKEARELISTNIAAWLRAPFDRRASARNAAAGRRPVRLFHRLLRAGGGGGGLALPQKEEKVSGSPDNEAQKVFGGFTFF